MIIDRNVEEKMRGDEIFLYFVTESLSNFFQKDWGDTAAYDPEATDSSRSGAFYRYENGEVLRIHAEGGEIKVGFAFQQCKEDGEKTPSKRRQMHELIYKHLMETDQFYLSLLVLLREEAQENHNW